MARSAQTVWECRTTGSDVNGGGFRAGASGTDWSQQNAAQYAVTDIVSTSGSATITSASANWGADVVGNLLYLSGGTGPITADRYEVITRTNATTIILDRTVGATGTGATGNLGGAVATFTELANATRGMVASNKAFIKATGTYTTTAIIAFAQSVVPAANALPSRLIGYTTTRGDGGRATIRLSTNTGLYAFNFTGQGWRCENILIDCNNLGTSSGIALNANYPKIINCKIINWTSNGILCVAAVNNPSVMRCEITAGNGTSGTSYAINLPQTSSAMGHITDNNLHDNVNAGGIFCAGGAVVVDNILTNNSGASSDGISVSGAHFVSNNTIYKSGRHGINSGDAFWNGPVMQGNILAENGGYGIVGASSAGLPADPEWDGNAFYLNTSGTRNNMDDTGGTNALNAVAPYTNIYDVILSADPFTAKGSNDFTLNNVVGGGAACRAAGLPRSWPGSSIAGYPDMGAVQHQDVIRPPSPPIHPGTFAYIG